MLTGKLECGFSYEIPDTVLDNMELVDAIAEADENPISISRVVTLLLGVEQKKALYNCLREEGGNVPISAVSAAVSEIFKASSLKN